MNEIEKFFSNLGYTVDWDTYHGINGECKWYEIFNEDNVLVCQLDFGIPLSAILEDFECIWKNIDSTSRYDYMINVKKWDVFEKLLNDIFGEREIPLHKIRWSLIGSTDKYTDLKNDIQHVCQDVTNAACIPEICIMDIVNTFKKHGYIIIKES